MAGLLPMIHRVGTDPDFQRSRPYFTYADLTTLRPVSWSREPISWTRVIEEARGPEPASVRTFIHRAVHPGSMLRKRDRISGLVDWVGAFYGPPGIDLGHCRVNCAILFGVNRADRFLSAYLDEPGAVEYEPHWDCRTAVEAPGDFPIDPTQWHDVSRSELDHAALRGRSLDASAHTEFNRLHGLGGAVRRRFR